MSKRIFDIVLAGLMLLLLIPLLACIWCGVLLEGAGSPLFRQKRYGLHNRPFVMYKFRTMHDSADAAIVAHASDKRITKMGKLLRRTHLDELPQLWNVLRGDMSMVGPRPLLLLNHSLKIKPGLTGLEQIKGRHRLISRPASRAYLIRYYEKRRTVCFDVKILLKTIVVVLKAKSF